jgi:PAS domain S-box-containing protein
VNVKDERPTYEELQARLEHLEREMAARMQTREAVATEWQRFNAVLDTLPAYLILLSPDHRVPFANRFFRERFGESRGRCCFDYLFGRSEPCEDCETFKVLATNAPHRWEWTGPDGRIYDIYDFPFTDADGSPLIMEMGIDITERRQAEAELRRHQEHLEELVKARTEKIESQNAALAGEIVERQRAEESLRQAKEGWERTFDSVPDLIAILDSGHRIVRANRAMAERLGLTPDQCIGLTCFAAVHESGAPPSFCPHVLTLRDGQEHMVELHEDRLGGDFLVSTTPITDGDGIIGSVHVARDITGQKRTEEALRNLAQFPQENPNPVLRIDGDGDILFANEPAREFLAAMGATADNPLPAVVRILVAEAFEQGSEIEAELDDEQGHTMWFAAIRPEGERYVNLYGRDITERKRAEEQLKELNETLEQRVATRTAEVALQATRLRALATELSHVEQRERKRLAGILHDHIQQLLVAARMQLESLRHHPRNRNFQATVQGVDSILKEAIDATRSLAVELSPPVLHEAGLIAGLSWLATKMMEKSQFKVELRSDSRAEPASEDIRLLLFECVRELLLNSLKHSGVQRAEVRMVRTRDESIKIVVQDEGKGFDPHVLEGQNQSFTTFGLFSIQERLAHIGGTLQIDTAIGGGTRATISIPPGEEQPLRDRREEVRDMGAGTGTISIEPADAKIRILIVDDHKIVREGLAGLLQFESDMDVVGHAADGPEAIDLAHKLEPDVIIMDVNLGEMNGIEATKIITKQKPGIRVIGLSMHIDKSLAAAMREAGAAAYLTKGGPCEDLIGAIRSCRKAGG